MSRYEWNEGDRRVSVGWDNPLNTFFAQIHDENVPDEEDPCVLWLGGFSGEYQKLETMLEKLPFAIPEELKIRLQDDKDHQGINSFDAVLPPHIKKIC